MAVCQNLVPLVNIKIAGKWMFIPLKMVLIGIDPYPNVLGMSRFRDDTIDSTPLIFQFLQLPAFYISYFHVKNNRGKPSKFSELLEMAIEMVKNYFSPPPNPLWEMLEDWNGRYGAKKTKTAKFPAKFPAKFQRRRPTRSSVYTGSFLQRYKRTHPDNISIEICLHI